MQNLSSEIFCRWPANRLRDPFFWILVALYLVSRHVLKPQTLIIIIMILHHFLIYLLVAYEKTHLAVSKLSLRTAFEKFYLAVSTSSSHLFAGCLRKISHDGFYIIFQPICCLPMQNLTWKFLHHLLTCTLVAYGKFHMAISTLSLKTICWLLMENLTWHLAHQFHTKELILILHTRTYTNFTQTNWYQFHKQQLIESPYHTVEVIQIHADELIKYQCHTEKPIQMSHRGSNTSHNYTISSNWSVVGWDKATIATQKKPANEGQRDSPIQRAVIADGWHHDHSVGCQLPHLRSKGKFPLRFSTCWCAINNFRKYQGRKFSTIFPIATELHHLIVSRTLHSPLLYEYQNGGGVQKDWEFF